MNGSSSSRQKDAASGSSQQRYKGRLALKRRAGAAAKAAQKYADFEVCVFVLLAVYRITVTGLLYWITVTPAGARFEVCSGRGKIWKIITAFM